MVRCRHDTIYYDTKNEFNVDSKASTRNQKKNKKNKKLKQTNASAHLVQYKSKIRESSPNDLALEERICERDEF